MPQTYNVRSTTFAGETIVLHPLAAAYWPAQSLLIVADLHFEKGTSLRRAGNPLPNYDSLLTVSRIQELIAYFEPEQVLCLGDNFHDHRAIVDMPPHVHTAIDNLVTTVDNWVWITGNHDDALELPFAGKRKLEYQIGAVVFRHIPRLGAGEFEIIGHYHPKQHLKIKGQKFSGKCFVLTSQQLFMPSLGAYTGGLFVDSQDFLDACHGPIKKIHTIIQKTVL